MQDRPPGNPPGGPPSRRRNAAALALLLAAGIVVAVLLGFFRGDGEPSCEAVALSSHGGPPAGQEDFTAAFAALTGAEALARQAEATTGEERSTLLATAETAFYAGAHDLTHAIDLVLCERDFGLAEDLRQTVVDAEVALGAKEDPAAARERLAQVTELLAQAAEALGYAGP